MNKTIRIHIDDRWTIDELTTFVETLQYFNETFLSHENLNRYQYNPEENPELLYIISKHLGKEVLFFDHRKLRRVSNFDKPRYDRFEKLKLIKFQYASPGIVDIGGIGKIIEQIKDLLLKILDFYDTRKEKKYARNELHLEQLASELSLGKDIYNTLRDMGFSESELRKIWRHDLKKLESISELVQDGKIRGIEDDIKNE